MPEKQMPKGTKMSDLRSMKPLHGFVLLTIPPKEDNLTSGGIVIPDGVKQSDLKLGIIQEVGPKIPMVENGLGQELRPGQTVLFDPRGEENVGFGDDRCLVPFAAIFAIVAQNTPKYPYSISPFFSLPSWKEFIGKDHNLWEQYENLTKFSLKVSFLEPFQELEKLARSTHECCVESLREVPDLDLSSIRYAKQNDNLLTVIEDDVWHGLFTVDQKNSYIEFQKVTTDVSGVHKTAPRLLSALVNTLATPEFQKVSGNDYSRVTSVVLRFYQRIKIESRGAHGTEATNSELMQQFLLFGQQGNNTATLDALALTSDQIGRIDMNVSFQKEVAGHEYRIFLKIEAPANDKHTILDIEWEIQDHSPGIVPERNYSPLFTTFFRDIVLRSFYKRWFHENDDVTCSTSKR